jgi:hypothetical protein
MLTMRLLQGRQRGEKAISPPQPLAGWTNWDGYCPSTTSGWGEREPECGIFYFLWQGDNASKTSEYKWDLSKIIPNHPEVLEDGDMKTGDPVERTLLLLGRAYLRYYRGDDYWVHLKNMQLLTDAQVDFLVLDATNALIYERQSHALMKAIRTLQEQEPILPDWSIIQIPNRVKRCRRSTTPSTGRVHLSGFPKPGTTWRKTLIIGRTKGTR